MFSFFKNLIKKKEFDPDTIIYEKYETDFGVFAKKRFTQEEQKNYSSYQDQNKFFLELKANNLFAWASNPYYKYSDFCLEADIGFEKDAPYCACGFIFRHINDENFYYFLISNRGFFRFDAVFNNNPMVLIPWTESKLILPDTTNTVMIIAHSSHFSFFINDEWIAEIEDVIIENGKLGFAAQNFNERSNAKVYMESFSIESRPIEVEKDYLRWTGHIPIKPENRILLARTFFGAGQYTAAAIQMKKAIKQKEAAADDLLFYAEILINLRIYDAASGYLEKALLIQPDRIEAVQEKANLLYLQNKFLAARDYINSVISLFEDNSLMWNLAGNCEYSLGNWDIAAGHYLKAAALSGQQPVFYMNAARAFEMNKETNKALEQYVRASHLFFREENYNDLSIILDKVLKIQPENKEVIALEAKMLFHEQKTAEARELIELLIDQKTEDSAIYYLYGLILNNQGEREKSINCFQKACQLDPEYFLYWYKLAENLYFTGQDTQEALQTAFQLNKDYAWTLNLFGLVEQKKGSIDKALEYFEKASGLAPGEIDILINYSDALYTKGKIDLSFKLLENGQIEESHRLLNHKGNLFSREKNYVKAVQNYERALKLDPENTIYMENLVSACIEIDMILRAEEVLLKLYDLSPRASVLNLVGNLALIKGEFKRAELSFEEAKKADPDNITYHCNLISVHLHKMDYLKVKEALTNSLSRFPDSADLIILQNRIRKTFETVYSCASCSRQWYVPSKLGIQDALRLYGEPPDDAPAGKCPVCEKVYCIQCAKPFIKEDRLTCPQHGEFLKLSEDWIKYLLMQIVNGQNDKG